MSDHLPSSISRRRLLAAAGATAGSISLAGCAGLTGNTSSGSASSGGPVQLTFVNWSGDAEKKAFDQLIAAFEKANPGITVKTETVPYANIQTNLDSRFASDNPPDLFRVSYIDIGQYTSQNVLLDLSSQFDSAAVQAFVPGLWQAILYDNKPYGVPHQIDTTAILYRKDAFASAGISSVPTSLDDAWSWDEFAAVAAKLTKVVKSNQKPFIYDWQSAGAYRWLSWLFQAGGNLLTDDLSAPAIDSAAGRRAVDFTAGFFDKGWVARNTSVKSTTYPDAAFTSGTVAMAFAGDFLIPTIDSGVKGFSYGALPMPKDVDAASDLGGNALVAAKGGKNTEAAAKFLAFAVEQQQMKTYCEATGQLPTLTALTQQKLDYSVRSELMETFVQQATTITAGQVKQVTVPAFGKINTILADELERSFLGGRSAAATTAALSTAVGQALK